MSFRVLNSLSPFYLSVDLSQASSLLFCPNIGFQFSNTYFLLLLKAWMYIVYVTYNSSLILYTGGILFTSCNYLYEP